MPSASALPPTETRQLCIFAAKTRSIPRELVKFCIKGGGKEVCLGSASWPPLTPTLLYSSFRKKPGAEITLHKPRFHVCASCAVETVANGIACKAGGKIAAKRNSAIRSKPARRPTLTISETPAAAADAAADADVSAAAEAWLLSFLWAIKC